MSLELETDVPLRAFNTFGIEATARRLVRVRSARDVRLVVDHPEWGRSPKFILGGGSNVLFTRDIDDAVVVKTEIRGLRVLEDDAHSTLIEVGAGESWHDVVIWALEQGFAGLENLALIPGTAGAAPVQNIGAYGLELSDRLESVDVVDLVTGRSATLPAAHCRLGYRDSIFKRELAGKSVITAIRLRLPKPWTPVAGYADVVRWLQRERISDPSPHDVFKAVCAIRTSKLPDPAQLGNAGSFFKNPVVNRTIRNEILEEHPDIVSYPLDDGTYKLAAAWMIAACGWKGKSLGNAGVHEQQPLVLVNRGGATGANVLELARAVQDSVEQKFGLRLEPEPVIL
ncbi:UDP-N-acetylmuramate dehydrogenase [Thiomonas arsenitoxydans]|uniref:UDP-N-acetylmuramate dehydrogenase n=1 Tax=Thiomonas arsenitoxydans (strain DSM 22701 / CIP 110005 / 3As) TaxID=426114 RepID=UPI001ACCE03E|nr:UDP-N-acetylmuramate dehydrogenase [Thiomonas arsenitoxydans]MBN8776816.1 UDP-N-acetylmuramate dehydrogenase [Thiomonas arsenitoxydans]